MNNYHKKRRRRYIATFLLTIFVQSLISPQMAWALTSGPTAPEAMNFEPVDATDMVNLQTGDFTYNIPLLEVPGPEGGYPLSLAYHAGIKPLEDASWVGLGWSLNAGAINRSVNGFADDFKDVGQSVLDYWEGGESKSLSFGVEVGLPAKKASVGLEISVSTDTYKGTRGDVGLTGSLGGDFGINAAIGTRGTSVGVGFKNGLGISVNTGDNEASLSVGYASKAGVRLGASLSTSGHVGLSANSKGGGLGLDMSSTGITPSISAAGSRTSLVGSTAGKISSYSNQTTVSIPVVVGTINFGRQYHRYWSNEHDKSRTYGVLQGKELPYDDIDANGPVDLSFDNYSLLEKGKETNNLTWAIGGAYPAYDSYQVLGQGISGSIQPYIFDNVSLFEEQERAPDSPGGNVSHYYDVDFATPSRMTKKVNFRFNNDFSNRLDRASNMGIAFTGNTIDEINPYGDDTPTAPVMNGQQGFKNDAANQHLAGSRHIEWFTNEEIANYDFAGSTLGLVDNSGLSAAERMKFNVLNYDISQQIGGFKITNSSGVTYHYTLPVYAYDEIASILKDDAQHGNSSNYQFNRHPYAYTWLLTAITGADYVDGGATGIKNGKVDGDDWGYWVAFDHSKWTDNYVWRTPFDGKNKGLMGETAMFSAGRKQLYYLDEVKTRTHTAIFEKELRDDALGVTNKFTGGISPAEDYINVAHPEVNVGKIRVANNIFFATYREFVSEELDNFKFKAINTAQKVLGLKKIHVLKNEEVGNLNINKSTGVSNIPSERTYSYNTDVDVDFFSTTFNTDDFTANLQDLIDDYQDDGVMTIGGRSYVEISELGYQGDALLSEISIGNLEESDHPVAINQFDNLWDENDDLNNVLESKALQTIDFNHDYSLSGATANSVAQSPSPSYADKGKYTLNSLKFKGQNGIELMPPLNFDYAKDVEVYSGSMQVTGCNRGRAIFSFGNAIDVALGDILKFEQDNRLFDAAVINIWESGGNTFYKVNFMVYPSNTSTLCTNTNHNLTFYKTKNPSYGRGQFDVWGNFKSDINTTELASSSSINSHERLPSQISAKSIDVWSLKEIETSLGAKIKINYEPKDIDHVEMTSDVAVSGFIDDNIEETDNGNGTFTLELEVDSETYQHVNIGDVIDAYVINTLFVPGNSPLIKSSLLENRTVTGKIYNSKKLVFNCTKTELRESYSAVGTSINSNYGIKDIIAGYVIYNRELSIPSYGEGVRVASINVESNTSNEDRTTRYDYTMGHTSYLPNALASYSGFAQKYDDVSRLVANQVPTKEFRRRFLKPMRDLYEDILILSREIPPPGVMYEFAEVEDFSGTEKISGKRKFRFRPFKKDMVSIADAPGTQIQWSQESNTYYPGGPAVGISKRKVLLKDKSAQVGNVLCMDQFNKQGQLISRTINNYTDDLLGSDCEVDLNEGESDYAAYNNQGIIHEAFNEVRFFDEKKVAIHQVISERKKFPSILKSTTTYEKGHSTTTKFNEYDFYSGAALEIETEDSYGNKYLAKTIPAYHKFPEMGLMVDDPANKNMLTQATAEFSCLLDANGNELPLSANVTTWEEDWNYRSETGSTILNNDSGIWRKHQSFTWEGETNPDGTLLGFQDFVWGSHYQTENWLKTSEITLYNQYSKALEMKDINGVYAATKMDYDKTHVIASATNARYNEFAFSGAEDCKNGQYCGGEVSHHDNVYHDPNPGLDAKVHTGNYSLKLEQGAGKEWGFNFKPKVAGSINRQYMAQVWVHKKDGDLVNENVHYLYAYVKDAAGNSLSDNAGNIYVKAKIADENTITAGNWHRLTLTLNLDDYPSSANWIDVGTHNPTGIAVFMDDFRFIPVTGAMTAYVYDQETGKLRFMLDGNHLYTEYEYDEAGRLYKTYVETTENPTGKRLATENLYNYGR